MTVSKGAGQDAEGSHEAGAVQSMPVMF